MKNNLPPRPVRKVLEKSCDFSSAYEYSISNFGKGSAKVRMYILNTTVSEMLSNFRLFESVNNVQNWPISTLIQRELDGERAAKMATGYLMATEKLVYFPPLIAVLIPTSDKYTPESAFLPSNDETLSEIRRRFVDSTTNYVNYGAPESNAGGIFQIPYGEAQGDIIWDKNSVTAIIIDGQHRYKALEIAVSKDKTFNECQVVINLIDLAEICKRTGKSPTEMARNLFVTINNTPNKVDESRLVLMDDKDTLATFTQILVDDSNYAKNGGPAIPPELIDWDCEGGKHNSANSISGVLVLRQIVLFAIFKDAKLSSIDDRMKKSNVRNWKARVETWLSPDKLISERLGASETLVERFKLANGAAKDNSEEDDTSAFLFTYNSEVTRILNEQFEKYYLPVFRAVYRNLHPYNQLLNLASNCGVLDKSKPLCDYYRSFKGSRKRLEEKSDFPSKERDLYERKFSDLTRNSIFHTVMGQKAVFETLFSFYLNTIDLSDENVEGDLKDRVNNFCKDFNLALARICKSSAADENVFLTTYKLRSGRVSKAKNIGEELWKGIITKFNGEIDYSNRSVLMLSSIFQDVLRHLANLGNEPAIEFKFSERDKLMEKHLRLLKTLGLGPEANINDLKDLEKLAWKVVESKEKAFSKLFEN